MAMPITLGTLVTRCQQRASREGDAQLDPTEYKDLISEKYAEMHALIAEKDPTFFAVEATLVLSALSLPAGYMSTLSVDYVFDTATDRRRPLDGPVSVQDRVGLVGLSGSVALFYAIDATALALFPTVTSGTYKHRYLAQPTDYSGSSDATAVDVVNVYGRQFILWGVTAIARAKGGEDSTFALDQELKARQQLEYWACQRALTHAAHRPIAASAQGPYTSRDSDWRCR
jgi:hypothetical protein